MLAVVPVIAVLVVRLESTQVESVLRSFMVMVSSYLFLLHGMYGMEKICSKIVIMMSKNKMKNVHVRVLSYRLSLIHT